MRSLSRSWSSKRVEWQERADPCSSEISEELLTERTKNPKPNKNEDHELERRDPFFFRDRGMAARIDRESCG